MKENKILAFTKTIIENMPNDWLTITTHRLDIYEEKLAKSQFLENFELLFNENNTHKDALKALPTAYDYIRLGHPLSCVLEWILAKINQKTPNEVICFSSRTMPVLAILRKNALDNKKTRILYSNELPECFDFEKIEKTYGYSFEIEKITNISNVKSYNGSTVFIDSIAEIEALKFVKEIDFYVQFYENLGSVLFVNGEKNESFIPEIQHVRRRESIAMTPQNCLVALNYIIEKRKINTLALSTESSKLNVVKSIQKIAGNSTKALVASSGLSIQYVILMGLVDYANENYNDKPIKIIVPTNCYGGTNDQARRVAAVIKNVEIVDLAVDGENDMATSIERVLSKIALEDAVPFIIAEIPTNPRVEVPNLEFLRDNLSKERTTKSGIKAVEPVFILDQTFCPNVSFVKENGLLENIKTISFASGSKFPSAGKCTSGYCIGNNKTNAIIDKIELHLYLCDNEATDLQYEILEKQLPTMNQRIKEAYVNTIDFVTFIEKVLPTAKINFVSEALANEGFTPSVFSMDLPTKGNSAQEKEDYKRMLNLRLINLMIKSIPNESKFCVSYGQLKGCYWTIPATSTQGTTKEGDKDYIVRASLSPNIDLELHKKVFNEFVASLKIE